MGKSKHQWSMFLPEEVVAVILLKLGGTGFLFRCKLVSKQWNSIISHPKFAQNYVQQAARCCSKSFQLWDFAFLPDSYPYLQQHLLNGGSVVDAPLPFLACIGSLVSKTDKKIGPIIASSSGLILSSTSFRPAIKQSHPLMKLELWVSNPVTKQSVQLPCLSGPFSDCLFGFTTRGGGGESAAFVTYKVVFIQRVKKGSLAVAGFVDSTIHIFSSDTGSWTAVKQLIRCPEAVFLYQNSPKAITRNGILHWFDRNTRTIVTYDPYGRPDRFGLIPLPSGSSKMCVDMLVSDHEDVLKFGEMEIEGRHTNVTDTQRMLSAIERTLRVWRLVDCGKGEWLLEKVCVTTQKRKQQLSNRISSVLALDHHKFFGYLFEVSSDPSMVMALSGPMLHERTLVPVLSCPWSSPFYGQAV